MKLSMSKIFARLILTVINGGILYFAWNYIGIHVASLKPIEFYQAAALAAAISVFMDLWRLEAVLKYHE